jgi:hypothetical protein
MASVGTFNEMMEQFLNELEQTFPEEKSFKKYHASFDIMRTANPRKCVDVFMKEASKYSSKIMQKDESVFDEFEHLDIKKYWTPELSQGTKDAIWQYLQTLNILGMTISTIPQEMLSMVEGVAAKCAEGMQNGDANPMSMLSSMSGLFGMLGGASSDEPPKKKQKLKELQ